jgi:hypothetical protein
MAALFHTRLLRRMESNGLDVVVAIHTAGVQTAARIELFWRRFWRSFDGRKSVLAGAAFRASV